MSRPPSLAQLRDDDFEDEDFAAPDRRGGSSPRTKRLLLDLAGRWHWIVLGLILGLLAAGYYLSKAPKQYTATSTLLIKQQTASVMARAQVEEIDMRSQEAMNTVAERIRRLDLLERVAARQEIRELPGLVPPQVDWLPGWFSERFGSTNPATDSMAVPPPNVLGGMIEQMLGVNIRRYTRLLDLSITHPVPEVSKALADAIAREYLAESATARTEGRTSLIGSLEKGSEQARENLQTARGALATYARALEVHQTLDAKEAEVAGLQRQYLPKHPRMITATAELERLQQNFIREFDVARQSPSDRDYWESAGRSLPDPATQSEDFVRMARQQLMERIGVLESEIESSTAVFNNMLTKMEESSVNQESGESLAEISSLARVPGRPSSPVARKIQGTGAAAGLAGGLALALLFIRLDNRYHTVAQLAGETGETVLAAISDIHPTHLALAEKRHLTRHPEDTPNPIQQDWDERLVFRPGASSSVYAEMFRVLRASVSLLGDETRRKVTLFSSALPGEGKTSVSANFALAAACQGRRTLLIDLDLRKPAIHNVFGMHREPQRGGVTEWLANIASFEDVIVTATGQDNLHLILAGKRAPNPGELLNVGRLKAILDQACSQYDVVVLDTAPLLAVPDTRIIAPLASNVCIVVRADYVSKGAIERLLQVLEEDGTRPSGLIFNGFKEKRRLIGQNHTYGYYKISRFGSSYRYGYDSSYGAYGDEEEEGAAPGKKRRNRRVKKNRRKGASPAA